MNKFKVGDRVVVDNIFIEDMEDIDDADSKFLLGLVGKKGVVEKIYPRADLGLIEYQVSLAPDFLLLGSELRKINRQVINK